MINIQLTEEQSDLITGLIQKHIETLETHLNESIYMDFDDIKEEEYDIESYKTIYKTLTGIEYKPFSIDEIFKK